MSPWIRTEGGGGGGGVRCEVEWVEMVEAGGGISGGREVNR